MQNRPVLLNSCASATTAAEARFRIDVPIAPARATRIVALDDVAAEVVRAVAELEWHTARFYAYTPATEQPAEVDGLSLLTMDGNTVQLVDELVGVDSTIMVAATDAGAEAAETVGAACTVRGIMTAGLVLAAGSDVGAALSALRPHARVLMVPAEQDDLVELLRAIRA